MDIDALHSALLSLTLLSEEIHSAREEITIATGGMPSVLGELLKGMERDLGIAKATLARELGFPVCRCCWPPEILVADRNAPAHCPVTQRPLYVSPSSSPEAIARRLRGALAPGTNRVLAAAPAD